MIESKRWTCSLLALVLALALLLGLFPFAPRTARAATIHFIGTASDLAAALVSATLSNLDTIKLTANIDYTANGTGGNPPFKITGISVTLDLDGYTLNVNSPDRVIEASSANLTLADPTKGKFNVTNAVGMVGMEGIYAITNSTVEVTSVKGGADGVWAGSNSTVTVHGSTEGTSGAGAYAQSNATVIVHGDATGDVYGARAGGNATVTVHGDATGGYGVRAQSNATVTVHGDVTATNPNGTGAWAFTGGTVTIDGAITANQYIGLGNTSGLPTVIKLPSDFEPITTKPGYYTYTDGTSTVWVKGLNYSTGGNRNPSNPVSQPTTPKHAFPVNGQVVGKRIDVYKLETLKARLFRLNKGDTFTILGLANSGRTLFIEQGDHQGYIALKDISFTLETPIKAAALRKAAAYIKLTSGRLKRTGYFPMEQTLWIYGISGKYLINKQTNETYYLDAGQWRLSLSAASGG